MQPISPNSTNFVTVTSYISPQSSNDSLHDQLPGLSSSALDLNMDSLPPVDTPDACDKAALRLRHLLRLLNNGTVASEVLQKNLQYAARVLESVFVDESMRMSYVNHELAEAQLDSVPPEIRDWLADTFTRQSMMSRRKVNERPKLCSAANAKRTSVYVDRIYRRVSNMAIMQFPAKIVKILKVIDEWSFDVFALADAANGKPIKYISYDLFHRYGIIHKFKISPATLETFLNRIEEGYCRYRNPYHNNLHASDVTQTVHHLLSQTGLKNSLTYLEIYAMLFAALIHDFEHTGTTNNFHVMSGSDIALLYNDRAVLENHHLSATFRLLKEDDCNILSNLTRAEFQEIRSLVIDMVLSTDMSFHSQQMKNIKNMITSNEGPVDKPKVLAFLLHGCDISQPGKPWNLHRRWTALLLEEFFQQGDLERELGLPFSPLCDRNNTLVAKSQLGFIEFIVEPCLLLMGDLLEYLLQKWKNLNVSNDASNVSVDSNISSCSSISGVNSNSRTTYRETCGERNLNLPIDCLVTEESKKMKFTICKPWVANLIENKKMWLDQSDKDHK